MAEAGFKPPDCAECNAYWEEHWGDMLDWWWAVRTCKVYPASAADPFWQARSWFQAYHAEHATSPFW